MTREDERVTAESLRAELLAVTGVASAEVDAADGTPAGVKVRLDPGADAQRVGVEVQRVLAAHGMRSRFSEPGDTPPPPSVTPSAPATSPVAAAPQPASPPVAPQTMTAPVPPVPPLSPPPPIAAVPTPPPSAPPTIAARLQSVAVEERPDGLTAIVSLANGRQAARTTGFAEHDLDGAVVGAFTEATGRAVQVVATEWIDVEGGSVVTVVIRREDATIGAGAAVMRAGRAFAVAAAARAALDA